MKTVALVLILINLIILGCSVKVPEQPALLIFSKTDGYRHQSIEYGADVIRQIAEEKAYHVVHTEEAAVFANVLSEDFNIIIFLNTTGDVLDPSQQEGFKRFIQEGGGFIGIHSAADTEYEWPWYGELIGGYFNGHPNDPNVREAVVRKVTDHDILDSIPESWTRSDEWYNYKGVSPSINVLQNLDETTYTGGNMGENHPITWYHEFDGGKVFYTGMGHTSSTYNEQIFKKLIGNAIDYVFQEKPVNNAKITMKGKLNAPDLEGAFIQ